MVHPSLPVRSIKDLVALAKARPGQINYASSGIGSPPRLATEHFKTMAQVNMAHIPYKGGGPAMVDLIAVQVSIYFNAILQALPYAKSGRLRALAVTSPKRSRIAPDVPTVAESGVPGFSVSGWWGILAPGATPKPIVARVQRDIAAAIATPEVQNRLARDGIEPIGSTPEQFSAYIRDAMARWARIVKDAGIRPD